MFDESACTAFRITRGGFPFIYSSYHCPAYKRLIRPRRTHLSQELAERLHKEETLNGKQDAKARKDREYEQRFRKELGK